jgi:hypothetical protein
MSVPQWNLTAALALSAVLAVLEVPSAAEAPAPTDVDAIEPPGVEDIVSPGEEATAPPAVEDWTGSRTSPADASTRLL